MNPYEILGIPPTASVAQIKSAYRRRAKETHPDVRKDDGTEFAAVSRAHAILIDPDLRKRFDETGAIDEVEPLTIRQRMITILASFLNGALNSAADNGARVEEHDLMQLMRDQVRDNLPIAQRTRNKFRKLVADRRVLLKRITRDGDGENVFATVIEAQLPEYEKALKQADYDVLALELAGEELKHYKSEVELIQAMQMAQYAGNYQNAYQTNQTVYFWGR